MKTLRRSRFRRAPSGNRLLLTSRDLEIFRALRRYRYLPSTHLHAFAGGASEKRFVERLGDLFHEGLINRPCQQWDFANGRYSSTVYELDVRAARILQDHDGRVDDSRTFLTSSVHRQFAHALLICESLASIELAALSTPYLRFVSCQEILSRAQKLAAGGEEQCGVPHIPVPDGLFGLEYQSGGKPSYRFFALELDRGTMPVRRTDPRQTSYLGKLAAYREVIARGSYKSCWGIPNLIVLTLTVSHERLLNILECDDVSTPDPRLLFKAADPLALIAPDSSLLLKPWLRRGLPALHIGTVG